MPYKASLIGCFAKVEHAKFHRNELASYIDGFLNKQENCIPISAQFDPSTGLHIYRIASVPSQITMFQQCVALRIGDIVHNLRSSLDHLVFQLACVTKNGTPNHPKRIQFPIEDDLKKYRDQERRWLAEVDPIYQAVIESYQSYHGRIHPDSWVGPYIHQLTLLRELSNCDKHQLPHTILAVPRGLCYTLPPGIRIVSPEFKSTTDCVEKNPFRYAGDELLPGVEIIREKLVGQSDQIVPQSLPSVGYAMLSITLEEKRRATDTLDRLEKYVQLILDDFKRRL